MNTCGTLATTGKMALPNFSLPMADESRASPSLSRDSNWLVECIKFAYEKHNLPVPEGVKGHQTCKMAVTYADMAGSDPQTICEAATWRNSITFARFYLLDSVANSDAEFGRRVLIHPSAASLGRISHTSEETFPPVDELNSNPDAFPLAVAPVLPNMTLAGVM